MDNEFLRIRQQRLARATKPFLARGASVQRCDRCQLSLSHCICPWRLSVEAELSFCLLMHDLEPLKPSNTGRLIADVLPDTRVFLWQRTEIDDGFARLLADPAWQPVVVFPASYAPAEQVVTKVDIGQDKRPLLILLDGTWKDARKMYHKSPYLQCLPVLSLDLATTSQYALRAAAHDHQLCTAEVAYHLLRQHGQEPSASVLEAYFRIFNQHYKDMRDSRPCRPTSPAHDYLLASRR